MTRLEKVIDTLEQLGCRPRRTGDQWQAHCPAHDDRNPSLNISESEDGKVLLHCFAGCPFEAIRGAIGVELIAPEEKWLQQVVNVNGTSRSTAKTQVSLTTNGSPGKLYDSAEEAIRVLEQGLGQRMTCSWPYHDADGAIVGQVARWDLSEGKKYRPVRRDGDGWRIGGMPASRPLYRLPEILKAPKGSRVYVTEGEKAADALREIGLLATTSAGGANAAKISDWQPLAGMDVVVLPDNDAPGKKYANDVAALTHSPSTHLKSVALPGLPDGGDARDWIDAHGDACEPQEFRRQLDELVENAPAWTPPVDPKAGQIERFRPFPVDALPEPARDLVTAEAKAIGCDPSYIALAVLAVAGSAIGNARRLRLKNNWRVSPIIWTAIVGESGTAKSPALKLATTPVFEREHRAYLHHSEELEHYETAIVQYKEALHGWKRAGQKGERPRKPLKPTAERCMTRDATVEAIASILQTTPRGLLLSIDELGTWLGSFDKYSNGRGSSDAAHWLSMHSGESLAVDRKTGDQKRIYVPSAAVCVCGGIQPEILKRALGKEHLENGLAARLLFTFPPRQPKRWTEADVDSKLVARYAEVVDGLFQLEPAEGEDGRRFPQVIGLTREAKKAFVAFYDKHANEQDQLSGEIAAAWSKLEEYAARFSLIIHCMRIASDDPNLRSQDFVDEISMEAGIRLAEWFKYEARRVCRLLSESQDERDQRRLFEFLQRKGEAVTASQVVAGCRWIRTVEEADAALDGLGRARIGRWEDRPPSRKGGRPTRVFVLSCVNETPTTARQDIGFTDTDVANGTSDEPVNEDWGEV